MNAPSAAIVGSSLGHFPTGERWEFGADVTDVFDDMLARSIPGLAVMRDLTFRLGRRFVTPGAAVLDLGCSRGDALAPFVAEFKQQNTYIGVETSAAMLASVRERFAYQIADGHVKILDRDLRTGIPRTMATSLVLSSLTLMFTPINYRPTLLQQIYDMLLPGGALILTEKILGGSALTDNLIQTEYHEFKHRQGYTSEEIARKALALEGVQVPVTAAWNEDMLRTAGFRKPECFWRYLNFAGWVAIK